MLQESAYWNSLQESDTLLHRLGISDVKATVGEPVAVGRLQTSEEARFAFLLDWANGTGRRGQPFLEPSSPCNVGGPGTARPRCCRRLSLKQTPRGP